MNSGATAERVYDAVKRRILSGIYRPGERIDAAALAQQLSSSATPVRDALHLLAGERLIETRAGDGFHVAQLDTPALRDLYAWSGQILLLALRKWNTAAAGIPGSDGLPAEAGERVGTAFAYIGSCTGNSEFQREISSVNDRLYAARMCESLLFKDWHKEISEIEAALARGIASELRRLVLSYHRRRQRSLMEIARILHKSVGT
ncbi:GntR family transcriptional regulator [Sphingomonas cannabina]|uniref:GntR family transcriptional regulator n=1 Tax=Sphingomonas cannabina TaxID=2899123 RepID=UPI001F2ACC3F|nr:GntR family transcriptional regulator [Sphingomonas cannabina]UIJ46347.1 GntR family transcriptional regulator [Sphingomonas cannabina]